MAGNDGHDKVKAFIKAYPQRSKRWRRWIKNGLIAALVAGGVAITMSVSYWIVWFIVINILTIDGALCDLGNEWNGEVKKNDEIL